MPGLLTVENAVRFLFAGNAKLTLVNRATGSRFTYKVQSPREQNPDRPVHFVKLLNGPDNYTNYAYLGTIFGGESARAEFRLTSKSCAGPDAPSATLFRFVFDDLKHGVLNDAYEVWHEGACGRCGRALTVPRSIATGVGPECASIMGIPMAEVEDAPVPDVDDEPDASPDAPAASTEAEEDRAAAEHDRVSSLIASLTAEIERSGGRVDGDLRPVLGAIARRALGVEV